jgi:hypothetical protein
VRQADTAERSAAGGEQWRAAASRGGAPHQQRMRWRGAGSTQSLSKWERPRHARRHRLSGQGGRTGRLDWAIDRSDAAARCGGGYRFARSSCE